MSNTYCISAVFFSTLLKPLSNCYGLQECVNFGNVGKCQEPSRGGMKGGKQIL